MKGKSMMQYAALRHTRGHCRKYACTLKKEPGSDDLYRSSPYRSSLPGLYRRNGFLNDDVSNGGQLTAPTRSHFLSTTMRAIKGASTSTPFELLMDESCCNRCPHHLVCFNGWSYQNPSLKAVSSASDSAVKQILLTLDERPGQSFMIEDLDEFHVLIRADEEQRVKRELEAEVRLLFSVAFLPVPQMVQLEKNTYSMEA